MTDRCCSEAVNRKFIGLALTLLACISLFAGCSAKEAEERPDMAEILAVEALNDFRHGDYYDALETFQKIKDRYPFSPQSLLAELKIADCNYYLGRFEEALVQYREFEENHPTNEAVPYVLFRVGMSHYKMLDTIDRDTSGAGDAIQVFTRLIKTYPDSPYNEEARTKILQAKDFLARHEFYVAGFYVRTKAFSQAIGRLQFILDNYPESSVTTQSRELLAEVQGKIEAGEAAKEEN